jgi:hypothetical protein
MKNWCGRVIFLIVLGNVRISSASQPTKSILSHRKPPRGMIEKILKPKNGSRISFAPEDEVFVVSARRDRKNEKPGSFFSHDAAPAALKIEAQAALAALAQAKAPIVQSPCDEKTFPRSVRSEKLNAKSRQNVSKKVLAAKKACEDVLAELNVATISATRKNPVERRDAFRKRKN